MSEKTQQIEQHVITDGSAPLHNQVTVGAETGSAPFSARCAGCHRPIVRQRTGRPRNTCSDPCRRRLDRVMKLVRRRQAWIAGWQRSAAVGQVSAAEARREIRTLEADIREFLAELLQP
jgi:hypothetical protein